MKSYIAPILIAAFLLICLVKINAVAGQGLGTLKSKAEYKRVYAAADNYSDEPGGKSRKYTSGPGTSSTGAVASDIIAMVDNPGKAASIVSAFTLGNEIGRERLTLSISQKRFSSKTNLHFTLQQTGNYKLEILDMNGTIVTVLAEGNGEEGERYEYQFNKGNYPAGTYIGRLITEHAVTSTRFEID
jgi:hypothetical protein